jgi:hypothetical protein
MQSAIGMRNARMEALLYAKAGVPRVA